MYQIVHENTNTNQNMIWLHFVFVTLSMIDPKFVFFKATTKKAQRYTTSKAVKSAHTKREFVMPYSEVPNREYAQE